MNVLKKVPLRTLSTFLENHTRNIKPVIFINIRNVHKSTPPPPPEEPKKSKFMEFFDDEKNWGATEVKSGRSWKLEELRLKSNIDLHKLWYILLKEHNMLLTMEEESKQQTRLFPSPERLDKVKDSMDNLEAVVKERNVAYHMLETGKPGIRETKPMKNPFGLEVQHTEQEYLIPKEQNEEWLKEHSFNPDDPDVKKFLALYREQEAKKRRQAKTRDFNHVIGLLKRYPKVDLEAVKEQYPDVDIEKAKRNSKARGHYVPSKYNINQ